MESYRVEDTWDWFSVSVVSSRVGWILPGTLLPLPWAHLGGLDLQLGRGQLHADLTGLVLVRPASS